MTGIDQSVTPILTVAVMQPAIPHYRVPLFARLASMKSLMLLVVASSDDGLGVSSVRASFPWAYVAGPARVIRFLGRRIRWQSGLLSIVLLFRPQVVVLHGAASNLTSLAALVACKIRGIRVIWWTHGGHVVSMRKPAVLVRVLLARIADGLLLYTSDEAADYAKLRLLRNFPVFALDNGVEYQSIRQALASVNRATVSQIASQIGDPSTTLRVLFCGRFTTKSDLSVLVDALRHCRQSVSAIFIGDGEQFDSVSAQAADLIKSRRVALVGAIIGHDRLAPYFAASDVFVYPGNMGLSGIEALAFGLPVVTHDNEAIQMPETAALVEGFNSLRFRCRDASSLAAVLDHLDVDRELLLRLRQRAHEIVRDRFDVEQSAARLAACLCSVAK